MPVLITQDSVTEGLGKIVGSDFAYFKKLNVTTIKGKTTCATKKSLLDEMVMQVIANEEIQVSTAACNCMKDEFTLTQSCEDV